MTSRASPTFVLVLLAVVGCGRGDGSRNDTDGSIVITARDEQVSDLHVDAAGKAQWLSRNEPGAVTSLHHHDDGGIITTWPDAPGTKVLAQMPRRGGRGLASLVNDATGAISLTVRDQATASTSTRLGTLVTRVMDGSADDLSADGLCRSRSPVWQTDPSGFPMSVWSLASNADESRWLVLLSTCGYVEAQVYDAQGAEVARHVLFEPAFEDPTSRFFVALTAELVAGRAGTLATIVVSDRPEFYQNDPQDSSVTLRVTVVGEGGTLVRQVNYTTPADVAIYGFGTEEVDGGVTRLAVAGGISTPTPGIPNDKEQEDAWLGVIDLATGVATATHSLHVSRDDFYRTASFSGGGVIAAGETDRHFVDSGSWDGGSQVLLTRYDGSLSVQESLTFGSARLDVAHEVLVLPDQVVVAGKWNGMPNNHLPQSDNWFQGFAAFLPVSGWTAP